MDVLPGLYYIAPEELGPFPIPIEALSPEGYKHVYNSSNRVAKHFGYEYNYVSKNIRIPTTPFTPNLLALADLAEKHCAEKGLICKFNQCIINKYEIGEGITKHIDNPQYGPVIACFTFGSGAAMHFDEHEIYVEPGSLYIMSGPARTDYTHEMRKRKTDIVNGKRVARGIRYSVTFRNVPSL